MTNLITEQWLTDHGFNHYKGEANAHHYSRTITMLHKRTNPCVVVSFNDYYCKQFDVDCMVWLAVSGDTIAFHPIKTVDQLSSLWQLVEGQDLTKADANPEAA